MKRNQALDILRGIAILLVIGHHYPYFYILWQVGWAGVDLFFVLSGFLVSGLLFDEFRRKGRIDIVRFWIRRGFKIYPAFYLLAAVTCIALLGVHKLNVGEMLVEATFLSNYFPHIWGHTWSLAVEEHFYLMLPLLLILLIKLSPSRPNPFSMVPCVFMTLAVACLVLRFIGFAHGTDALTLHTETHLRVDSLFAGVLLSYWYHFYPEKFRKVATKPLWLLAVPLLLPAAILPMGGEFMDTVGLTALYVGFVCILACSVILPATRNPLARAVAWIGKYSYSIYLWHVPLREIIYRGHIDLRFLLVGGTASIILGVAMAEVVEIPGLKAREKLFPSRSRAV